MKYISEVQLGALGNGAGIGTDGDSSHELNTRTYRPTEAQKAILANIDKLSGVGGTVVAADAMNVPQEELEQKQLDQGNMEGAFKQLEDIGLITVDQEGIVTLTPEGQEEVQQIEDTMPDEGEPADFEGDADLDGELAAGPEDEFAPDETDQGLGSGREDEYADPAEDEYADPAEDDDMDTESDEERPRQRPRRRMESYTLLQYMQGSLLETALLKKLR